MEIYRWIAPETNTITPYVKRRMCIECVLCEVNKRERAKERQYLWENEEESTIYGMQIKIELKY